MILNEKVVLGKTEEDSIIIANIDVRESKEFSVSFDEIAPFEATEEYLKAYFEGYIEQLDESTVFDLLKQYDCPYSELEERVFNDSLYYDGVEGIMDISLYPENFTIEGFEDDIYFESWGCGQGDHRKSIIPLDKKFSDKLHKLWDEYHLEKIPTEILNELKQEIEQYQKKFELDSTVEELATEIMKAI